MKTSTMLLITAILIVLGCLTAFNIDLEKAYLTGAYRSRFKDMTFTPVKGVKEIYVQNIDLVGVTIEHGNKEGIWINKEASDLINFKTEGDKLYIRITDQNAKESHYYNQGIVIITKDLSSIVTRTLPAKHKDPHFFVQSIETTVTGYQVQNLHLNISALVNLSLNKMQIQTLNATIGTKEKGQAALELSPDTKVSSALFEVPGKSKLTLTNPDITKAVYHLSDSATVTLNGKLTRFVK